MERTIPDSDTGPPPAFFSLAVFLGIFLSVRGFSSPACGTGAHAEEAMTDRCDDATPNETMSQFSLHRHLMISNNEVTNIVGGGGTGENKAV